MVRKGMHSGALVLCLLIIPSSLPALERTMELGKDSLWREMKEYEGVSRAPGRWGYGDLVLSTAEY